VFLYTPIKKRSVHGTLVGSVAGAVPPVVGYCSVSGRIDVAACLLFLIVVLWQMPHFYAITLYKLSDYSAANIPVHPLARGIESTKKQMLFYTLCFGVASILPTLLGFKGMIYISVAAACSIFWLALAFQGLKTSSNDIWAKKMFKASLVIIMTLSAAISL